MQPKTDGNLPVADKNPTPPVQPVPKDHEEQTPEWLQTLIKELNEVRDERSQLFAQSMEKPQTFGSTSYKSNVQATWERQQRDDALDRKEDSIMQKLRTYLYLIPPAQRPQSLGFVGSTY